MAQRATAQQAFAPQRSTEEPASNSTDNNGQLGAALC